MVTNSPTIILIEDDPYDAALTKLVLKLAGFNVTIANSVIAGEDLAMLLLDPSKQQPVGIVTDLMLNDLMLQRIEGSALAAVLVGRMLDSVIRSAPVVAITNDLTAERQTEALSAGCALVLPKPLHIDRASQIYTLVMHPQDIPIFDPARRAGIQLLRRFMEKVLASLRENQLPSIWTAEDVFQILCAVTSYTAPRNARFTLDQHRQAILLRSLGGSQLAKQLIQRYSLMEQHHPAGPMAALYLDGLPTKTVIKTMVERGYGQSYMYRVNEQLPDHISRWLAPRI